MAPYRSAPGFSLPEPKIKITRAEKRILLCSAFSFGRDALRKSHGVGFLAKAVKRSVIANGEVAPKVTDEDGLI